VFAAAFAGQIGVWGDPSSIEPQTYNEEPEGLSHSNAQVQMSSYPVFSTR
jgi:hypothetical protein